MLRSFFIQLVTRYDKMHWNHHHQQEKLKHRRENISKYSPKSLYQSQHFRQATDTSMSCTGKSTSSRADLAKPQMPAWLGSKDVLGGPWWCRNDV